MRERGSGHIINISTIGLQMNTPRFSAYVASKAALDAFSRSIAPEIIDDGVHVTTVYMPLVRTPMIAPTKIYDRFPTLSPEEAADMICRGDPQATQARGHDARQPRPAELRLRARRPGSRRQPGLQAVPRGATQDATTTEKPPSSGRLPRATRGVHW